MVWGEREFRESYSEHYEFSEFDSSRFQRYSLAKELMRVVSEGKVVVDLGSGKGALISQVKSFPELRKLKLASLDIANLCGSKFIGNSAHVQGSGAKLPYKSEVVDIVWSNMAMDLMPRSVFSEVNRVLLPGGKLLANLHHPILTKVTDRVYEEEIRKLNKALMNYDRYGGQRNAKQVRKAQLVVESLKFRRYVMPDMIFNSPREIGRFMGSMVSGRWSEVKVKEMNYGNEFWYFLEATKK